MPRILVAGAGIGGLSAALALSAAGAEVTLLEREPALREAGAGLQLSPNATRILARLGVLEPLTDVALAPTAIRVRAALSGRPLAVMPLGEAVYRWGSPYLVVHRADLQKALLAAVAADPAITLELDTTLAGFGVAADGVSATVRQGRMSRTLAADALIGADGIHSSVRARLAGDADRPTETGRTAWRALIPADLLDTDMRRAETNLWLGRDAHLVHYPLRGGTVVNVVAITRDATTPDPSDLWSRPGDPDVIRSRFARWHASARKLVDGAPSWQTWPLYDRAPLASWSAGPIALLGDAAHPILPFLAQGAAQAIEDAAALGAALSTSRNLADALATYSDTRRERAGKVQDQSRELGRLYHFAGPAAVARNLGMKALGGRRLLARYDWLYGVGRQQR